MSFFETLVALLAVAVVLLQITRRVHLPYPGILAAAGVAVAMVPGAPNIPIDPHTALALFIAPVLVDSAYDFPLAAARRMLLPIFVYAVVAVLATTGVVVLISALTVGLPIIVALTLGAMSLLRMLRLLARFCQGYRSTAEWILCSRARACSTTRPPFCCSVRP